MISINPNPANDHLYVYHLYNIDEISLIDMTGRPVLAKDVTGKNNTVINTSRMMDGMYIVQFTGQNMYLHKKIIKH